MGMFMTMVVILLAWIATAGFTVYFGFTYDIEWLKILGAIMVMVTILLVGLFE